MDTCVKEDDFFGPIEVYRRLTVERLPPALRANIAMELLLDGCDHFGGLASS